MAETGPRSVSQVSTANLKNLRHFDLYAYVAGDSTSGTVSRLMEACVSHDNGRVVQAAVDHAAVAPADTPHRHEVAIVFQQGASMTEQAHIRDCLRAHGATLRS